jgi:hypothetical protein
MGLNPPETPPFLIIDLSLDHFVPATAQLKIIHRQKAIANSSIRGYRYNQMVHFFPV